MNILPVSISVASAETGIAQATIRKAIKAGRLTTYPVSNGRDGVHHRSLVGVDLGDIARTIKQRKRRTTNGSEQPAQSAPSISEMRPIMITASVAREKVFDEISTAELAAELHRRVGT